MTTDDRPTALTTAQMVIGGESVDAADGQTFDVVNPATGTVIATAPLGGRGRRRPGRRGGPGGVRGPQGLGDLGGRQARPDAGQARRPDQGPHRGAGPAREPQRRQADHRRARRDHRREPRVRLLRRRRQQDLRPDDPGLEAGARPDPARADRRRRADRALELPAADGLVEGRAGAGRREHRDPQARQLLPVDGDPARRAGARGGHPGRRPQRRDRARAARPARRSRPTRASARSPSPARRRPARRSCGWPRAT